MANGEGQKTIGAGSPHKPRMTVARRIEATSGVIRGEPMERIARSSGVTAAEAGLRHEALFEGAGCAVGRERIKLLRQEDRPAAVLVG